jgi:lysophospholipase
MRLRLSAAVPAIALSLVVSACGDGASRAPFAESRTPPSLSARFYPPQGWAWGYVQVGDGPVQRYGVAAPPVAPRATILILAGYGETAEKWFETTSELTGRGFTVWVLERQGQGGSERLTPWRDLGHVNSFDPDVSAVKALVKTVIRPRSGQRLIVLGHGEGGLVGLRAAQAGLPMDRLVLTSPAFGLSYLPRPRADFARFAPALRTLRLGWIRTSDQRAWRRDAPDGRSEGLTHDAERGKVQAAWMLANPDLRMGGRSLGWFAAFIDASEAAARDIGRTTVPVLMLSAGRDVVVTTTPQARLCREMKACRQVRYSDGGHDLHMESDGVRSPWLNEIVSFAASQPPPKPSPAKDQVHGL